MRALTLEGIKVIETAAVIAGPMAGRLLADWGADVIHVESPEGGEIIRNIQDSSGKMGGLLATKAIQSEVNFETENHNRNKRSMTLNLSHEGGRKIMVNMLKKADVFLSNFRPRELEKFRLEYPILSELNPRLIFANVTGFGRKGLDKDAPGFDFMAFWARSGILHELLKPGMEPLITPRAMGDRMTALALACGIMTALFLRERTGIGQEVDVSLFNTGVFAITSELGGTLITGEDLQQVDRKDMLNAAATFYQAKDGRWLRLGMVQTDPYWSRFCAALEREDLEHDPRFDSYESRIENHEALFNILEMVFLTKPLEEWKVRLTEAGLPWGPLQNLPEVIKDPQARANDFFDTYDHPTYGPMELMGNPIKLSKTPSTIRMPAPEFGQHTEEVLLEYGYTWDDIERFNREGIIA